MQKVRPAGIRPAFSRRMNRLWTEEEGKGRFFLWAPDAVLLWVRKTGLRPPALRMTRALIFPSPVGMGTAFGDPLFSLFLIEKNRTSGSGDPGDRFSAPTSASQAKTFAVHLPPKAAGCSSGNGLKPWQRLWRRDEDPSLLLHPSKRTSPAISLSLKTGSLLIAFVHTPPLPLHTILKKGKGVGFFVFRVHVSSLHQARRQAGRHPDAGRISAQGNHHPCQPFPCVFAAIPESGELRLSLVLGIRLGIGHRHRSRRDRIVVPHSVLVIAPRPVKFGHLINASAGPCLTVLPGTITHFRQKTEMFFYPGKNRFPGLLAPLFPAIRIDILKAIWIWPHFTNIMKV